MHNKEKNSIFFVNPDYHYSFTYCEELRKKGWKAGIYVAPNYPSHLSDYRQHFVKKPFFTIKGMNRYIYTIWMIKNAFRYQTFVFYGKIRLPKYFTTKHRFSSVLRNKRIVLELAILKKMKRTLIFLPSGCHDEFLQKEFLFFDGGNVCNNCGFYDRCDDNANLMNFEIVRKYFTTSINLGFYDTPHYKSEVIKYKCIKVSQNFVSHKNESKDEANLNRVIRIMHATSLETRNSNGKNIKGSDYVGKAIDRLRAEGFNCEYINLKGVSVSEMAQAQIESDIYIDQLIYGMWGSAAIEAMALGKPVICYLRPEWKEKFLKNFGYSQLPIIEATIENIYEVLRDLLLDKTKIFQQGEYSRKFASEHYNISSNVNEFIQLIYKSKK